MNKKFFLFLLVVCVILISTQIISAQTQDVPKIISAEVNVDTGLDMLSVSHFGNYLSGYFNQGFYETMIEDIAFDISFSTGNGDRKIKKITVSDGSSIWATFIHEGMPLLVYSDGVRIYDSRQPDIRTFPRNKINKITVYAQPKNKNVYSSEYWKNNTKSSVKIFFTDGTVASTPVISVSSTPTKPVVKPIIEKAQLINQSNQDLITEKGSLSSFGIPGDVVFDVDINMNGTSKTISYFAIKKSSQSTNLWSTNQSGISGSGLIYSDEVTILPYGLLVTKNNQKLNNPLEKKRVITLGTYSGQSKISFRLYADKYAGPDFTDDSEIYIVFNDGTIISKKISVSNANSSLSSTDPAITKVTLSDNSTKSNSIRESMYGNSKYWLWNIDLDLKNINRNISFISISMRNQRWSTDETYGSLLTIYDNGKVISNSSRKILGALGTGTKKLTVYGLKENDARYDISNAGTVYIAFDDGFVISYALSNESVTNLLENIDIEFPVLPQDNYLSSGYNVGEGLVLGWKPSTDNVGVAGYKIYRADYITPVKGSSYTGPFVVIGDTKNVYFTDSDPKLDKSKYYSYYVRAYDLAGNLSYPYNVVFLKINDLISRKIGLTIDKERPSAPQKVVAKYAVPGHISLSWNDSSDDVGVLGYKIYRDGLQIGTLQTSRGGSFSDYDIKPGNSYTYNISAYDAQMNESVLSSSVTEFYPSDSSTISTKDQTAPTAPYNLTTRAVSASKIDFSWSPSTDNVGVAGYKIYRDEKEISTTKGTSYGDTGLQPGSAYSYYIRAFDVAGNISQKSSYLTEFTQNSATVTATKDTQAPSYPPNLIARAVSSSQIDITWSPSADNVGVAGYIIYRNNLEIGRTTNLSYRDSGLSAGTDYSYSVKAYDAAGNQSYMSNSVTEFTSSNQTTINNTRDTSAPSSPSNLTTRSVSITKIEFSWSPSTDNVGVVGYKIYRDDREISSITGTSYSDNGLQPGSAYSYYVKAYDSAGNLSQRSSYLTEFTQAAVIINNAPSDTQAPSYPPNLNIRAISSSQIEISWSPSTDNVGVMGYIIYRNNTEISRTTGTSYRDSGLSAGTDYSYSVKAYDAAGNQSYMSNSVTEWTLSDVSQNNIQPVNYLSSVINAVTQILLGKSFTK